MEETGKIVPVDVNREMKDAYLSYAMSVIVGRALPDIRDGLKPVQRRILYAMHEMNLRHSEPYKKSARLVGDVLGKYHPHGDMAVYDALVRMAQNFTYRYPLVDGHGNFGSIDGDPPAAMRYTEVRMSPIASEMLRDLEKETVDFIPNFDESLQEPMVLPAAFPQLLANGASGIAVGMATNIPPHNLTELIDACLYLLDHPQASVDDLLEIIPGPDFPTYGKVVGREGIRDYFREGKGKLVLRGEVEVEEIGRHKMALLIKELPYQVNKANLVENIAHLIDEKKLSDVSEVRDESDREGIRIVLELKKGAQPQRITRYLYRHTALEVSFGVILLALVDGRPETLGMKEALLHFLEHRRQVILRRSAHDLREGKDRLHILEGFLRALDDIDRVIQLIRSSSSVSEAKERLQKEMDFSEKQAQAILDLRLQRLVALEREKILTEYEELKKEIRRLEEILEKEEALKGVIRKELEEIKEKYGDARRTRIVEEEGGEGEIEDVELYPEEDVVITLTRDGYIKRTSLDSYRRQGRGGKGVTGILTKEEDAVSQIVVSTTWHRLLLFTSSGRVFQLLSRNLPDASRSSRGVHLVNLLPLEEGERVFTFLSLRDFGVGKHLFFVTSKGKVKKVDLLEFVSITRRGLKAIELEEGDELASVFISGGKDHVLLATAQGYGITFSEENVRPMGRGARGVRGINLRPGDRVVGAVPLEANKHLVLVSTGGWGKRLEHALLPRHRRGGKGIRIMQINKKVGEVVGIALAEEKDEILLSSQEGILIRLAVANIPVQGRAARGVKLIRLNEGDRLASFALS
ncbi:MAG TPA: DNA gyrase subunit A [Candidatus Atribacteria bacterium]|nr:DNA gyrase subunit A [Candidatus Atribacteria bacterium]